MKLGRVFIPALATLGVLAIGVTVVALVANGVLASEPSDEPKPAATPIASQQDDTKTNNTPELPEATKDIELVLPNLPASPKEPVSQVQQQVGTGRTAPPPVPQGTTYTWEDGDRTLSVLLQDELVVEKNAGLSTSDVVVVKGAVNSIVRKQAWHGADSDPVFKSESGGELMTLPGGVLLALDPEWNEDQVNDFLSENNISPDQVSEMGFIENGFLIETESGFPSLEIANELAAQDGVLISSPNWSREVEAK